MLEWILDWLFGRQVGRSGKWPRLAKDHLTLHPECAVCGCDDDCTAHHIVPVSVDPARELDPENLITLCECHCCHLGPGHLWDWRSYNPDIEADARAWRRKIERRP